MTDLKRRLEEAEACAMELFRLRWLQFPEVELERSKSLFGCQRLT